MSYIVVSPLARIAEMAEALIQAGRRADTPVAAIQSATLPEQRHVIGTLRSIAADVQQAQLGAPMVIVVGDVVGMHRLTRLMNTLVDTAS